MDRKLRQLQRNAYTSNTVEDWQRYCHSLERLNGLEAPANLNVAGSPLEALIQSAGNQQQLEKEIDAARARENRRLTEQIVEIMQKHGADYFDFQAPPDVCKKISEIPSNYHPPSKFLESNLYRFKLEYASQHRFLSVRLMIDGKERCSMTEGSNFDRSGERMHILLKAMLEKSI